MAQLNNNDHFNRVIILPKLRRIKNPDHNEGDKYFEALKQAVFSPCDNPYTPSAPPDVFQDKTKNSHYYRCKQCNDCFRFSSTFEEHIKRRSWILGFWCTACFVANCSHVPRSRGPCESCTIINQKKISYLQTRGLRKNQKRGMIKIFYNQCKFFEHLETHGIKVVDSNVVMLMPLPSGIDKQYYNKLDEICGPLFEYMFLNNAHIVDWLKSGNIMNSWWMIESLKNDCVTPLIKGFKSSEYFDNLLDDLLINNKEIEQYSSLRNSPRVSPNLINLDQNDEEEEERSDNPCSPVDIAFVDCGSTSNAYSINTQLTKEVDPVKTASHFTPKISVKKFANDSNWTKLNTIEKKMPNLMKKTQNAASVASNLIPISSTSSTLLHGPKLNSDTKILRVRGPKGVNLSTLIKQLPHDVINNKKIVFVGQQTEKPPNLNIAMNSNVMTYKSIMPVMSDNKKPKFIKILPTPKKPTTTNFIQPVETKANKSSETIVNGVEEVKNVYLYKNGKKYLMKRTDKKCNPAPEPILQSPVIVGEAKTIKTSNETSFPTPMDTSEPQTSSSDSNKKIESQSIHFVINLLETDFSGEQLKICEDSKKNPIMKSVKKLRRCSFQATVCRYRNQMLGKLIQIAPHELLNKIEHFRNLIKRCKQIINPKLENISVGHSNMIQILIRAYEKSKQNKIPDHKIIDEEYESYLDKWEVGLNIAKLNRCVTCSKVCKPETYLFGLSKETKNPAKYCTCSEFICYQCNLYQGFVWERFKAHIDYHQKKNAFICPECFQKFKSYNKLAVHVWTNCFHVLTRRLLGCNVCQIGGFESMEALARHFALMHAVKKVSCSKCLRIFKTHDECKQHQINDHENETDNKILKIIVCDVGDCVVHPKHFRCHINAHMGTQKLIYYQCPVCSAFIKDTGRGKEVIKLHLYVYHLDKLSNVIEKDVLSEIINSGIPDIVRTDNAAFLDQSKTESSKIMYPKIVDTCTISPEVFERDEKQSDVNEDKLNNGVQLPQKSTPKSSPVLEIRSKPENTVKNSLKPENTVKIAPKTENLISSTPKSNKRKSKSDLSSGRKKVQRKPGRIALNGPLSSNEGTQNYKCHLCGELINTSWSVVRDHFGNKHSDTYKLSILTPTLLRISNEFIERGYQEFITKKRKSEGSVSPQKRRKRWTPKKHTENTSAEKLSGICVMPESSRNDEGHFICKKCEKQCESADALRNHIASSHRIKDVYLICLECGENFIVAPSLQMHLKAFHGVEDPISYLESNPLHASKAVDDFDEKLKTMVANQCHVCKAVFENKAAVDKHLRVHGMAFLNKKRIEAKQGNKSPDNEKIKIETKDVIAINVKDKDTENNCTKIKE